jgi:lipoate-protein ligase A
VEIRVDKSRNPVENLRREEELFRRVESGELPELVRFWVNSECLVRGKARSSKYGWYHEAVAQKMGVMVIERATGGGVVYHDEGNLNWSFFLRNAGPLLSPTKMFEQASAHMTKALGSLGVEALFAPPNRIDVHGRKVSGMAAKSTPKARLVHGTLLLNADLEKLNRLCIPPPGCPPVSNVSEWVDPIGADDVVRAFVKSLRDSGAKTRVVPKPSNLAK